MVYPTRSKPSLPLRVVSLAVVAALASVTILAFLGDDAEAVSQTVKLRPQQDGGARFGTAVDISGDVMVVGAPMLGTGEVNVYRRQVSGLWAFETRLSVGSSGDQFGASVAVSGNTIVVGSPKPNLFAIGTAYVFVRPVSSWTLQAVLSASDGQTFDQFGFSVAIDGDTVLIGSPRDDFPFTSDQGSAYVFTRAGTSWTQQAKLVASDPAAGDQFGSAVALDVNTALIGSRFDDGTFVDQGSAYVFTRTGTTWTQQAKLTANDAAASDQFGYSVALDTDTAVIGSYLDDDAGSASGSAYVFSRSGTTWTQQTKLTASDAAGFDQFGTSVALNADTALIGSLFDDGALGDQGSVYAFTRSGTIWTQQAKLTAADAGLGDRFGSSVAIDLDRAAIGAPFDDEVVSDTGSAYAFSRTGSVWSQEHKAKMVETTTGDSFGDAVAIDGDTVIVGSPKDDVSGLSDVGSADVYTRIGAAWTLQTTLTANDRAASDTFGGSVAIDGNTALVGSPNDDDAGSSSGSVYVFVRNGTVWTQQAKLTANDAASIDQFGWSVALDADTALVASPVDDDAGSSSGSAYVFTRNGTVWTQQAKLIAVDGASNDQFGLDLALSGETALIGSPFHDGAGSNAGAAYVFVRNGTAWSQQVKLTAADGASADQFGKSVALDGNNAIIGSPFDTGAASAAGSAYAFSRAGTTWSQTAKLVASDTMANDHFGTSVALDGATALVGSPDDDGAFSGMGSAYLFAQIGSAWLQQAKLTALDAATSDTFGHVVGLDAKTAIIGTPLDDDDGTSAGSAYIFDVALAPIVGFSFSPSLPAAAQVVQFTDLSVDVDGTIVSRAWDFDDGSTSTATDPQHAFATYGIYSVRLTVVDDEGRTSFVARDVIVPSIPPVAAFDPTPSGPFTGEAVQFTDRSADPDGPMVQWNWNFGDGFTSTLRHPAHAYANNGAYIVTLTVTDDFGASDSTTALVTVLNRAPSPAFSFTPSSPSPGTPVQFTDASVDTDGTIASRSWNFGDGGTSTLAAPTHAFANPGTYAVSLTVTDNDGTVATLSSSVTVVNLAPLSAFSVSPSVPAPGVAAQFSDASSDSDGTVTAWAWDFGDGVTSTSRNPSHTYASSGTYTVTLTVTDNRGASSAATQSLEVAPPGGSNLPPVAAFSRTPVQPAVGETVSFTDGSTDSDGNVVSRAWNFGDGATANTTNPSHAYATDGVYTVSLIVMDNVGATSTATQTILVMNSAPTAAFGATPGEPAVGQTVLFTDASTDEDGTIVSHAWLFGDGGASTLASPSHAYGGTGTFDVTLTVTDDGGATASATRTIHVSNAAPVAAFSFSPGEPMPGQAVAFTDASTDLEGPIASHAWNFGDGTTSDVANPAHAFAPGVYAVTLIVTDAAGGMDSATRTVVVRNAAPLAGISYAPFQPSAGTVVAFHDASVDPDGTIVARAWNFGDGTVSTDANPLHVFTQSGLFTVSLIVTDDGGLAAGVQVTVHVTNAAPHAGISHSPSEPFAGIAMSFTDASVDTDGSVVLRAWNFGDGSTSNETDPVHVYDAPGTYTVTLVVTDNGGLTDAAQVAIVVVNPPPSAAFSYGPTEPSVLDDVVFADLSTDPNGFVVEWFWDFGDGGLSTDQNPTHWFDECGDYAVRLTVTDDHGATDTALRVVHVDLLRLEGPAGPVVVPCPT